MMTGLRPETFESLQLNAGVFLRDLDYASAKNKGALEELVLAALETEQGLLGATRGGGTFVCKPTMRAVEADGMRSPVKGANVIDAWEIKLTSTLLEITPDNFAAALACCDITKDGGKTKLSVRDEIKDEDYIPHLIWVGDTSKGLVLIDLHNALNVSGANFTFTDKGEGTLPVEFQAHLDDVKSMGKAPVDIIFFDAA